jgi:hypothetical protein
MARANRGIGESCGGSRLCRCGFGGSFDELAVDGEGTDAYKGDQVGAFPLILLPGVSTVSLVR